MYLVKNDLAHQRSSNTLHSKSATVHFVFFLENALSPKRTHGNPQPAARPSSLKVHSCDSCWPSVENLAAVALAVPMCALGPGPTAVKLVVVTTSPTLVSTELFLDPHLRESMRLQVASSCQPCARCRLDVPTPHSLQPRTRFTSLHFVYYLYTT
ncbi:hypothetical protein Zmor_000719 [Zophobas morio]|uniref:Uncharacterized protein n=1 Tax=Zophobas morio TaxID=2755281 RepID=A0AA38MS00_9CUCU|nr:hypothetical protein Zmor_000719 [Zophobas morio]